MTEDWRIQVSPKLADGTLINLRASDKDEAERILNWAIEKADLITAAARAFSGVSQMAQQLGGQVVEHQPAPWSGAAQSIPAAQAPSWSQQGSQQPGAGQRQGRFCTHGAMAYREAKPDSGKDWRAYFCPTPKGTPGQCEAVFLKKGEAA